MGEITGRGYEAHPETEMVAGADPDSDNLEAFCKRFKVGARYSDYRDMLAKEKLDIVSVVVPVRAQPQIVIDCAEAGVRAIFGEKPISASLEEADKMVEVCRAKGIPFACGAIWRNHPYLQKAKELLEAGEIGKVISITLFGMYPEISGHGCHPLNIMRLWAQDADVDEVIGWMEGDPASENDQAAGGCLHFANGIEGYIQMPLTAKRGMEVLGEYGALGWNWSSVHILKDMVPWNPRGIIDLEEVPFPYPQVKYHHLYPGLTNQIQSLLDCLEKGGEPLTSGDDMRKVLEIAIALRESHRKGRVPVQLPIKDRSLKIIPQPYRWLGGKASRAQ
jgi:predicted dehydrogenase